MPSMELRLEKLINAVQIISNIDDLNDETPVAVRKQDPDSGRVVTIVCSVVEPTLMVLPMNVVWIVFDKKSPFYKQAMRRTSKSPNSLTPQFDQSWQLLYFYDDVFQEQWYDPADLENSDVEPVLHALIDRYGLVRLSVPSSTPFAPAVISEGHYTLTNNRDPLTHNHPEKPATMIETESSVAYIADQAAPAVGMALVCGADESAVWRSLDEADVDMEGYV